MWHVSTGILAALSVRFFQCRFISVFFFSQVCAYYCYDLFSGCNFGFITWNTLETWRAFLISCKPSLTWRKIPVSRMLLIHKEILLRSSDRKVSSRLCVIWALLSSLKPRFALIKLTLLLYSSRIDQSLLLKCQDYQRGNPLAENWVGNHEPRTLVLSTCLNSLTQGGGNEPK